MIGWILVGLVLASFAALGVWQLVLRRKWDWPSGTRHEGLWRGYQATFICGPGVESTLDAPPNVVARGCAMAAWALATEWAKHAKSPNNRSRVERDFAVHVLTDEDYDRIYDAFARRVYQNPNLRSAGMLREVTTMAGNRTIPLVACRASRFASTLTHGSLVIHELTHELLQETPGVVHGDLTHSTPGFWVGTGEHPLEKKAQELYVANRAKVGL